MKASRASQIYLTIIKTTNVCVGYDSPLQKRFVLVGRIANTSGFAVIVQAWLLTDFHA
uniref:Uncharacterized protein n=1 Tax=Anguilla anguilla TaxID=7936 RepID=A0A0E9WHZ0_ANGAN